MVRGGEEEVLGEAVEASAGESAHEPSLVWVSVGRDSWVLEGVEVQKWWRSCGFEVQGR